MYKLLLDFIVEHKIFVEIKGISLAGTEKTLVKSSDVIDAYVQKNCIFTGAMVHTVLFHENGCTIVLKH